MCRMVPLPGNKVRHTSCIEMFAARRCQKHGSVAKDKCNRQAIASAWQSASSAFIAFPKLLLLRCCLKDEHLLRPSAGAGADSAGLVRASFSESFGHGDRLQLNQNAIGFSATLGSSQGTSAKCQVMKRPGTFQLTALCQRSHVI